MGFNIRGGLFIVVALWVGCERDSDVILETEEETVLDANAENIQDHDESTDYNWDLDDEIPIGLNSNSITTSGSGVKADESQLTITSAGTYRISGTLNDGQIIVDTQEDSLVRLILNGVDITCSYSAPIYVKDAGKAIIVLAANTKNILTDGSFYSTDDEDVNATIFSKQNLTILGEGSLEVKANFNDGITSKDGLIISSGEITVEALDDGIRGKDYLVIKDGAITVNAMGDGLKSDNDEESGTGFITIEKGTLNITAAGDAIQAAQDVQIYDGEIELKAGGGSDAIVGSSTSAKGIKSGMSTLIYGGTITVDAADDALHTDGNMTIYDGSFFLASGDDGMHSEYDMEFSAGTVSITKSYEGLESALGSITINGGQFNIVASDDGINVSAGGTSSGGGPGMKSTTVSSTYALVITGGYLVIDCEGDGLDSNDLLNISGGTQLVNSAEFNENSALDYDGDCVVSGGFLVAVGTSRMSEAPGSSSSQYSFLIDFSSKLSAGNIIHIQDNDGSEILTYQPIKSFQSIVFSSPALQKGSTYEVYIGGSSTGAPTNGLYTTGSYSGGTKYTSFTISNLVTTL
jgi:hypothetical protein